MTEFEKLIYNLFKLAYCSSNGKPYSFRKDFGSVDDKTKDKLSKLESFFKKYNNIPPKYFFEAPYKIYNDGYYDLDYFLSRKALKTYSLYKNILLNSGPDSDYNLEKVIESLKFIKWFCKEKSIQIDKYLYNKTGIVYDFVDHLVRNKISIYVLFYYDDFKSIFSQIMIDDKKFIFGDMYLNWDIMYRKYMNSEKCRKLVQQGFDKLKKS